MEYTRKFIELKTLFSPEKKEIRIPGSEISIHNIGFHSDDPSSDFMNRNDTVIRENHDFTYPVFAPANRESTKVIFLFHGLNERSWQKYLAWAFYLAEQTHSYVILFPISFHINRSPEEWKDPRAMLRLMNEPLVPREKIYCASFANAALSRRLTEDPSRFFKSGYQTVRDIVKLTGSVKEGEHAIIPKTSDINFFAYSIGAFLAEIIIMGNPKNYYDDSKLFMFCGGSVFSNMKGSSKLIMDSAAFDKVYDFYLNDFESTIKGKSPLIDFLKSDRLGMAFRSMIDLSRLKTFRESVIKKLKDQIHSVSLKRDKVIPPAGILATLNGCTRSNIAEIWDFPYEYSHENPFPVLAAPESLNVDKSFEKVFESAVTFLR